MANVTDTFTYENLQAQRFLHPLVDLFKHTITLLNKMRGNKYKVSNLNM